MKGEPLKDYIARRWRTTPLPEGGGDIPAWGTDPNESNPLDRFLPRRVPKTEQQKRIERHYNQTVAQVLSELVSGQLTALGRLKLDEGSLSDPMEIQPRFWLNARPHFEYGAASDEKQYFDPIKVFPPTRDATIEMDRSETEKAPSPDASQTCSIDLSVVSREEIRQHAIDACAAPNQLDWWQKGPDDRRAGYAAHLTTHRLNVVRAIGDGADSWDATENRYKKSIGRLKS